MYFFAGSLPNSANKGIGHSIDDTTPPKPHAKIVPLKCSLQSAVLKDKRLGT
jgi:hypothetical protein